MHTRRMQGRAPQDITGVGGVEGFREEGEVLGEGAVAVVGGKVEGGLVAVLFFVVFLKNVGGV